MAEVNIASDDRGIQETTSRTFNSAFDSRFCVKKVDQECNGQEDKKGYQVEKFFPFFFHTINRFLIFFILIIIYIYSIGL